MLVSTCGTSPAETEVTNVLNSSSKSTDTNESLTTAKKLLDLPSISHSAPKKEILNN